ncbi:MAG: hypothetical protein ACK47B_12360 [Armatimonadota bacterium]
MLRLGNLRLLFVDNDAGSLHAAMSSFRDAAGASVAATALIGVIVDYSGSQSSESDEFPYVERIVGCPNVEKLADRIASIYLRYRCSIAILDLHLGAPYDESESTTVQLSGVALAKLLYRNAGTHYVIWQSRLAANLVMDITPQVMRQVTSPAGPDLCVIECPRSYIVERTMTPYLMAAMDVISEDIFDRLARSRIEWRIPAAQLGALQTLLGRIGSVKHGLEHMDGGELDSARQFELVPHFDPPTPFGLWLQTHEERDGEPDPASLFAQLRDLPPLGSAAPTQELDERSRLAIALTDWLDVNLWGLPVDLLPELLNLAAEEARVVPEVELLQRSVTTGECPVTSSPDDRFQCHLNAVLEDLLALPGSIEVASGEREPEAGGRAYIARCSRQGLLTILAGLLANAHAGGKDVPGHKVTLLVNPATCGTTRSLVLLVLNRVPDAVDLCNRIRKAAVPFRGLLYVQSAIEGMNRLEQGRDGSTGGWAFRCSIWQDGECRSHDPFGGEGNVMETSPWTVGELPAEIWDQQVAVLRTRTAGGAFVASMIRVPLESSGSKGSDASS